MNKMKVRTIKLVLEMFSGMAIMGVCILIYIAVGLIRGDPLDTLIENTLHPFLIVIIVGGGLSIITWIIIMIVLFVRHKLGNRK
jgi:hypothetical protein